MTEPVAVPLAAEASPGEPWPAGWDCHVHVFDRSAPARGGHYQPQTWPLTTIEALAHAEGIGHLVLVQPSVYGSDNSLLLKALRQQPGRHRGVVVVEPDTPVAVLEAMHALGVRGVRMNLVSPVGEAAGGFAGEPARTAAWLARRLEPLMPHLSGLGWHVQWYARAEQLPAIADWHDRHRLTCVLDHLGGLRADIGVDHAAWRAAARLAERGAWIKLSGWYRLGAEAPYRPLVSHIQRVASLFGDRMVWASDWPHTSFAPEALPSYRSTWQPVVDALGPDAALVLRNKTSPIYGR